MALKMTECQSSNIHSHGHDPETNTLAVCFRRGTGPGNTYHYSGVSADMYAQLQAATSVGEWFHKSIRGNSERHPGTKQP